MSVRGVVRGPVRGPVRGTALPADAFISGGTTVYLSDTFTDTNGTALTAHTMNVGGGWSGHGSQFFDIQGNATREQFGATGAVSADATVASGVYRVTMSALGGYWALRLTDADNMIFADNPSATHLRLQRRQTGADTVIVENSSLTTITYPAQIVITVSGNSFTVLVAAQAGQSIAGSESFNNTATRFGFRSQTSLITYDNFSFQSA